MNMPVNRPNFFEQFAQRPDVQAQQKGAVPGRTVPPQQSYETPSRQSSVVPGSRVQGRDTGNQLQDRMDDIADSGGSPLASYMKTRQNTKRGGQEGPQGTQQPAGGPSATPSQSPTPAPSIWEASPELFNKAFQQQASQFMPADITEEEYKQAFSGDFAAFQKLMTKMNVHTASMTAANQTRITKSGLDKEFESFKGQLPKYQQEQQFQRLFDGVDHPIVSNPKLAPLLKSTTDYFRGEFPDATPEEIREGVLAYMEDQLGSAQPRSSQRQQTTSMASHFDNAMYEGFDDQ